MLIEGLKYLCGNPQIILRKNLEFLNRNSQILFAKQLYFNFKYLLKHTTILHSYRISIQ